MAYTPNGDLIFSAPQGGADLVFGDDSGSSSAGDAVLSAAFPPLTFSGVAAPTVRATLTASMPDFWFSATAENTSTVARPVVSPAAASWQTAEHTGQPGVEAQYQAASGAHASAVSAFGPAAGAVAGAEARRHKILYPAPIAGRSKHENAQRTGAGGCSTGYSETVRDRRLHRASGHQDAVRVIRVESSGFQDCDRDPRLATRSKHASAAPGKRSQISRSVRTAVINRHSWCDWWQDGRTPPPGVYTPTGPVIPPPDTSCYPRTPHLVFSVLAGGTDLVFICDNYIDVPTAKSIVPVRRVYMLTNTTTLYREDTGVEIPATNLQVGIDADSWDWQWSATVPTNARSLLAGDYGSLVVFLAEINGTLFRLALDRQPRQREFGKSSMSIGGRGRAMMLDAPYATQLTRYAAETSTAQQLMTAALTENGVSIGWSVDWQIDDWVVPPGIWSHTGTAIDACLAIAGSAGAYIQAHQADQVLSVLPRYPVAPWNWSDVTPDIELPESAVVAESDDPIDKPAYNTVFISGQEGGLQVHVTRAGTAGDRPAQMVTDPLITHVDAGRQRGLSILGDTGRQRPLSLSLPVFQETGIILPGKFIRYVAGGSSVIGLTRAVSVNSDRPRTRQTILLETHDVL